MINFDEMEIVSVDEAVIRFKKSPKIAWRFRLEYKSGESNKYWEACNDGEHIHTRYGRIGKSERIELRDWEYVFRKASEKLRKGYCPVSTRELKPSTQEKIVEPKPRRKRAGKSIAATGSLQEIMKRRRMQSEW